MSWCLDIDNAGTLTGSLCTMVSVLNFIQAVVSYHYAFEDPTSINHYKKNEAIENMAIWGALALISILFVMGIVKKIAYLLLPSLLLEVLFFFVIMYIFFLFFTGLGYGSPSPKFMVMLFIIGGFCVGLWGLIFWLTCTLYNDILKKNIEKSNSAKRQKCETTLV